MKRRRPDPYPGEIDSRMDGLPRIRGLAPQLAKAKALKGSTLGPAGPGRRLSDEEREAVVKKMREDGKL